MKAKLRIWNVVSKDLNEVHIQCSFGGQHDSGGTGGSSKHFHVKFESNPKF